MTAGTLRELCAVEMGPPLHSLVLLGKRSHELERDYIKAFALDVESFDRAWEALSRKEVM